MKPSSKTILQLKSTLLHAVLTQTPLPGTDGVISFPDIRYILEAEEVVVSEENLVLPLASELNVHVLTSEEIKRRSHGNEPFPYVRFQSPEFRDNRLIVALEVRLAFGNLDALCLGAIVAEFFLQSDKTWKASEKPKVLAS